MRKTPDPNQFTAIIDTREKTPWTLAPLKSIKGSLVTGDYSIKGLEHIIAIERKSLTDFVMCVGRERERFDKECQRLLAYSVRAIVVEATMADLELGAWRGRTSPQSVCGSMAGWMAMGLPILLGGSPESCARQVSRMLYIGARRRYEESREFMESQYVKC